MSTRRQIETTVLALLGVLLAVAVLYDLHSEIGVNHRLIADLATWRHSTGHRYHDLTIEQNVEHRGTREVVCGNTSPGPPSARVRLCLIVAGPVRAGRRAVLGGYYLPPYVEDAGRNRYACYGVAKRERLCRAGAGGATEVGAATEAPATGAG